MEIDASLSRSTFELEVADGSIEDVYPTENAWLSWAARTPHGFARCCCCPRSGHAR